MVASLPANINKSPSSPSDSLIGPVFSLTSRKQRRSAGVGHSASTVASGVALAVAGADVATGALAAGTYVAALWV